MKPDNNVGIGILVTPPSQHNNTKIEQPGNNGYDAEVYVVLAINAKNNIKVSRRNLSRIATGIREVVLQSLRNLSTNESTEPWLDSAILYEFMPANSGDGIRVTYRHLSSGKSAYVLVKKVSKALEIIDEIGIPSCGRPLQANLSIKKENVNLNYLNRLVQKLINDYCSESRGDKFLGSLIVKGLHALLLILMIAYSNICNGLREILEE